MGQILEHLGEIDNAIGSYKHSLQLDGGQKDVLIKVCELYCQIEIDPERSRVSLLVNFFTLQIR